MKYGMDEILNDLKDLISDNSIYHLITKKDIEKIINKYDKGFQDYLEKNFNLMDYNEDGFVINLDRTYELDVNEFKSKVKKKFNKKVEIETIGYYEDEKTVYLYFIFY